MSKFNSHTQAADNRTRIADQQRALHAKATRVSSSFKPFDPAGPLGMRREDIEVFAAAARGFDCIVILRSTNVNALQYIGKKGYVPKPFDCKIKTADTDAFVPGLARKVKCGGLVVDPTVTGFSAFKDERVDEARDEWAKFIRDKTRTEQKRNIYPRHHTKGFYAVDTDPASEHFGCLMLSEQAVPGPTFRLDSPDCGEFKRTHMRYIHSDYDLYGLIDVAGTEEAVRNSAGRDKFSPVRHEEKLQGLPHYYSTGFEDIKAFINNAIGIDMIQHAAQDNLKHLGDTLYAFYPIGSKYQIVGSVDAIREIYDHALQQDVRR